MQPLRINDHGIYNYSKVTHIFGILLPLYMMIVSIMYLRKDTPLVLFVLAVCLSAVMLSFHLSYETVRKKLS